ncbi:MAG: SprT family zinc-dependent metalloprotease [Bdellovibrionales bacterium]|nr:SprT family zinc-dependent metalloprotease [Bdellovibrionales bacterium]
MEQLSFFSLIRDLKDSSLERPSSFTYKDVLIILLRRPYQRSLFLSVEKGGQVKVNCSRNTCFKEITVFLESHWKWVQRQISEQKKIKKKYPVKRFYEGESFLFKGKIFKLKYKNISVHKKDFQTPSSSSFFYIKEKHLIYGWYGVADLDRKILNKKLRDFYKKEGEQSLHSALSHFSSRMDLHPHSVRIGSQRSLWGSCSSAGRISLNWRLVAAPPEVLTYVVIHELAHLRYLNHSNAFWSLVFLFCPHYKKQESWLKQHVYAMDFLLPYPELHGS